MGTMLRIIIVIAYVPDLNDIPIEENYVDISQEETKNNIQTVPKSPEEGEMIANIKLIL